MFNSLYPDQVGPSVSCLQRLSADATYLVALQSADAAYIVALQSMVSIFFIQGKYAFFIFFHKGNIKIHANHLTEDLKSLRNVVCFKLKKLLSGLMGTEFRLIWNRLQIFRT